MRPHIADAPAIRLSACPRCGSRRRLLDEIHHELRALCLGCGWERHPPLTVEVDSET
jgi:hypothetical protein